MEQVVIAAPAAGLAESLLEEPVGKRDGVVRGQENDVGGQQVEHVVQPLALGNYRRLGPLSFGDVPGRGEYARDLAPRIPIDARVVEHIDEMPVAVTDGQGVVGDRAFGKDAAVAFAGLVRLGKILGEIGADELDASGPGSRYRGLVHIGNPALAVDRDQRIERCLDQAARVLRRYGQPLLDQLTFLNLGCQL